MTRGHGWSLTITMRETFTPYSLPAFTGAFDLAPLSSFLNMLTEKEINGLHNVAKGQAQKKCLILNYETGMYHETFGKKGLLPVRARCFRCYHGSLLLGWEIRIATRVAMFTTRYI